LLPTPLTCSLRGVTRGCRQRSQGTIGGSRLQRLEGHTAGEGNLGITGMRPPPPAQRRHAKGEREGGQSGGRRGSTIEEVINAGKGLQGAVGGVQTKRVPGLRGRKFQNRPTEHKKVVFRAMENSESRKFKGRKSRSPAQGKGRERKTRGWPSEHEFDDQSPNVAASLGAWRRVGGHQSAAQRPQPKLGVIRASLPHPPRQIMH